MFLSSLCLVSVRSSACDEALSERWAPSFAPAHPLTCIHAAAHVYHPAFSCGGLLVTMMPIMLTLLNLGAVHRHTMTFTSSAERHRSPPLILALAFMPPHLTGGIPLCHVGVSLTASACRATPLVGVALSLSPYSVPSASSAHPLTWLPPSSRASR